MRNFGVSPNAAEDINNIWSYLAQEVDESLADTMLRRFVTAFGDLAEFPGKGHLREDLTSLPLHFYLLDRYLIVYSRNSSPLAIHAVLHSSRDIRSLLRKRSVTLP
jgi:plasmid stabilization system protein ParE